MWVLAEATYHNVLYTLIPSNSERQAENTNDMNGLRMSTQGEG